MDQDLDFMVGDNAAGRLMGIVQRIERLEEEKQVIASDIKEVVDEAKSEGFDTPTLRKVIRIRKMDPKDRKEQERLLELYLKAASGASVIA